MSSAPVAEQVRSRVEHGGAQFWEAADFDDLGDRSAVWQALHRLVAGNEVRRVRKGLYWRGAVVSAFPRNVSQ